MSKQLDNQRDYWDRTVDDFDSIYSHGKSKFDNWIDTTFRWDMYARFDYTIENSAPIEGRTFLDVGPGTGRYVFEFLKRGARHVTGIDIADNMLAVCRERAQAEGVADRCTFIQSDLLKFNPDTKFDVTIGIGLFDYVPDALPVLTKMREVTTDRAIASFPLLWTWRAPVRRVRLALKGCDVYFYSLEKLDSLIKKAGFTSYQLKTVGQLYCVTMFV